MDSGPSTFNLFLVDPNRCLGDQTSLSPKSQSHLRYVQSLPHPAPRPPAPFMIFLYLKYLAGLTSPNKINLRCHLQF